MQILRSAFSESLDPAISEIVSCTQTDQRLIPFDIEGSIAHAKMLAGVGLISTKEANSIINGLKQIHSDWQNGEYILNPDYEDVHMNIEKRLEEIIGSDALKLHTARSRNDQIALDLRLFMTNSIKLLQQKIEQLQIVIAHCALNNIDIVMPGYTHLQQAQPVLFAHALHAYIVMLKRDHQRMADCLKRTRVSPLGAAAQSGTSLPIDPALSAKLLGLDSIFENSLDAVSDRDFLAEFCFCATLTATHLSQMAETLIIWASQEFSFIQLTDKITTASSLMPQKKNPDAIEIIRAKAATILASLVEVLTILKGLPQGYNRDLQETKAPAIRSIDELSKAISALTVSFQNLSTCPEPTLTAASNPAIISTDLVEYLVKKGQPFRLAHEQVSKLVAYSTQTGIPLNKLPISTYKNFSVHFETAILELFDPSTSISNKCSAGSTNKTMVKKALTSFLETKSSAQRA